MGIATMKPAGYLLTTKSGATSGTAHKASLDFWKPKEGDKVNVLYTDEQVKVMLMTVFFNQRTVYDSLIAIDNAVDEAIQSMNKTESKPK